jgi:3-hydroxyisobutyrate dehydrogenase-like beta-hydroxyacid dehydrogenase
MGSEAKRAAMRRAARPKSGGFRWYTPRRSRRCAGLANERGVGFVDAPVLGSRKSAERGELVILESGPEEARPRVQPVFDAIAKRTLRAGEAGAGTRLKVTGQGEGGVHRRERRE